MLKVIFTLDYEIHGDGTGNPYRLMVEPTQRMMDEFERYGAKLTIMADVAEMLKFKQYARDTGHDDYYDEAISGQLREAIRRGHDVQLHLHPSYFNAHHEKGRWIQDWAEYNLAALPKERVAELIRIGRRYLEELLIPENASYRCTVFRAANWAVSPSENIIRALLENGFEMDTSVFKYGARKGLVSFDYSTAPSELVPWTVDEQDICRQSNTGRLIEAPIYCEQRWIGAFLTLNRLYRAWVGRFHHIQEVNRGGGDRAQQKLRGLLRRHAWKADFNQCSGRQLIGALKRAASKYGTGSQALPFVLIGHSKLFTRSNQRSLRPFLSFVADHPDRFEAGTFSDLNLQSLRTGDEASQTVELTKS